LLHVGVAAESDASENLRRSWYFRITDTTAACNAF